MNSAQGVIVSKPVPILKKSLKLNFKELSKAIGKAGVDLSFGKWEGVAGSAMDMLTSLGLKVGASEVAWLLIYRSLMRACKQLVEETIAINTNAKSVDDLHQSLVNILCERPVTLGRKFFERPEDDPLVSHAANALQEWFKTQGMEQHDSAIVSGRLRAYFPASLHEEWASAPAEYQLLSSQLDTPFTRASDRRFGWIRYSAWLQKQIEQPMFLETFCLRQVFVPLRASFNRRVEAAPNQGELAIDHESPKKGECVVVDLNVELNDWLERGDKNDAIRLISGGPGSGKSSFAKMFAAANSAKKNFAILFIQLHHFDPSADLIEEVGKFVSLQGILSGNPMDLEYGEPRLLLIFDGLDELALQGKTGERTAQEFVREVHRKVDQLNQHSLKLQVIISGRELVIQSNETSFRRDGQILSVLPYFVPEQDRKKYVDSLHLLKGDQRQTWWMLYGEAIGEKFSGLPSNLDTGNLIEITSQPLLNYLVALALRRGKLKLSAQTNLNSIYADLLRAIYERGWSTGQHVAIRGLTEQDFNRVLEEIALAAWHGDGRTTTVKDIEAHCNSSGLENLLRRFQTGLETDSRASVTQLLTAFYFRQSGHDKSGERTFEFTHKSFGEYLTARRIIRELRIICRKIKERERDSDEGWDFREALQRWILLCSETAIDEYLFSFICDEIQISCTEASCWQETLCRLMEFILKQGLPMERIAPRTSFQNESRKARNAEESLLIVLNACARSTRVVSRIRWPDELSFGNWLARICGQRRFTSSQVVKCLSYLDLQSCVLITKDLWHGNLESSDLRRAALVGADCRYANFKNADLRGVNLVYGNFIGAKFESARLGGPNANDRADFVVAYRHTLGDEKCYLYQASFKKADLEGVSFAGLDVRSVDFSEACLKSADFRLATITPEQASDMTKLGAEISNAIVSALPAVRTVTRRARNSRVVVADIP
jgi:hypothetical protein